MKDQVMTEHDGTTSYEEDNDAPVRLPWSVMAVVSFALGLASLAVFVVPVLSWPLSILAIVLGHSGRREIKQGAKQGWGFDIAGLIFGYFVLALLLIAAVAGNQR
jgi:hypothetical protein